MLRKVKKLTMRENQLADYWRHLQKALALVDPKAPPCHKKHPFDDTKWCDSKGPGGFMGHTCKEFDGGTSPLKAEPTERINHPAHYGGDTVYEAIKVIDAWELGFELGCTVKYIKRSGKDIDQVMPGWMRVPGLLEKRIEDLKKAEWYLHHKIEQLEKAARPISDIERPSSEVLKRG